ncbi:MAG: electron transfer flavoprotein subunit alpha/FixB family protein [Candidatus Rokubacteria bacterium]|nr:electron transfer flavoprotein subunit alpha/FixB family protein [Candidatus Rokubacteria bacterium]
MILGLVEHDRGRLDEASLEMLTLARRLAREPGVPLHAVLVGGEARPLAARLGAYGVAAVHLVRHERLGDYAPEAWARSVAGLVEAERPEAVLAAGTDRGNEVMAHVAARSGLPLAANCIEVQPGEPYLVTRLRWGGSLLEEARLGGAVKLLTVAPHAVPAEEAPVAGEVPVREVTPALTDADLRVRVTKRIEAARGGVSLADARVVVSGGRGVGSPEGFKALEELAALLGGAVGCSRVATSLGWRPHTDQVGQTGTRVAPELYIACGVSGAIQHLVGCKGAKRILAINTDPEAPIVARADYAIIGDLHAIVPALAAEIRKAKGERPR